MGAFAGHSRAGCAVLLGQAWQSVVALAGQVWCWDRWVERPREGWPKPGIGTTEPAIYTTNLLGDLASPERPTAGEITDGSLTC
jgi:hypothetical protein